MKFTDIFNLEKFTEAWGYIKQYITQAVNAAKSSSQITIENGTPGEGILASHVVKQGGTVIGTINIPKDLAVVQDGSTIVTATSSNPITVDGKEYKSGKFVSLKIQNQTNPVYINVQELVDVYTAQQNAAQVQITVDSATNVISADIVDGSIDTDALANKAVTADKLSDAVNTSLGKANTAVQSVTATAASGNDGTVTVDGNEVAVKGYSDLKSKVGSLETNAVEIEIVSSANVQAIFKDDIE